MSIVNLNQNVPSQQEIDELENRLAEMKKAREETKNQLVAILKSSVDEIPEILETNDLTRLMGAIQRKLRGKHRKVRGSPVPDELKSSLVNTLKDEKKQMTLGQLESMFGVSTSYIMRIKKDLGLTKHKEPAAA